METVALMEENDLLQIFDSFSTVTSRLNTLNLQGIIKITEQSILLYRKGN